MNLRNRYLFSAFISSFLTTHMLYANINGTVFQDLPANGSTQNSYGVKDANELGVAGITVTAYPDNISTVTASDGSWSLATTVDSRIEFTDIPAYLKESADGGAKNASVQFATNGSTVNLGLHNPADYFANSTVDLITSVHSGSVNFGSEFVLVKYSETSGSNSTANLTSYQSPAFTNLAQEQQIGAIWGMAYDRNHGQILAGAFVKRFARLAGNPTTIYSVPANGGTPTTWIILDSGRTDPHGATPNWSQDYTVVGSVGKEGLGDVDIAEDGSEVYTIDMGTRELVQIPVNSDGSAGTPVRIALPTALADCANTDDVRPMGLGVHNGKVYVGAVCSAESTVSGLPISNTDNRVGDPSKLRGYVHVWDGASSFSEVLNFPLDYERGCLNSAGMVGGGSCTGFAVADWQGWTATYPFNSMGGIGAHGYPQPMISDIEFNNGDMIIGMVDRFGHMDGSNAAEEAGFSSGQLTISGDILHPCQTGTDSWIMEKLISGDASCSSAGLGYDSTRAQTLDEYYFEDDMGDIVTGNHADISEGGVAVIPGRNQIIMSVMDPARGAPWSDPVTGADPWQSHGLHWYDDSDGSWLKGYLLVDEGQPGDQPIWGKVTV